MSGRIAGARRAVLARVVDAILAIPARRALSPHCGPLAALASGLHVAGGW